MKALQFFLILISLIFAGCMEKWQGFGTLQAGMTRNQVQKAYGEPFQNMLLKRVDGGFIEFWFLIPLALLMDLSRLLLKTASW